MFWFSMCSSFLFCALASRDELQSRKVKLDYDEVGTCQKDVINVWDKKLLNCRAKIRCDMEDIHSTLKEGIYGGWLLTMKSEDFCCCCSLLIRKEICQQYTFSSSTKSWKNGLLFANTPTSCCQRENRFCCVCSLQCQQCRNMYSHTSESSVSCPCIITSKIDLELLQLTLTFWFLFCDSYPIDSEFQMLWFY